MSVNVVTKPVATCPTAEESKERMIEEAEKDYQELLAKKGMPVDLEASLSEPPPYDEVCAAPRPSHGYPCPMREDKRFSRRFARRLNTTTSLCVLLLLLLLITVAVIGGTYLYRMMPRHKSLGWCQIPLNGEGWENFEDREAFLRRHIAQMEQRHSLLKDAEKGAASDFLLPVPRSSPQPAEASLVQNVLNELSNVFNDLRDEEEKATQDDPFSMSRPFAPERHFLKEHFEIDLETNPDLEDIEVPDFGGSREGRFLHDFRLNLTGIVDYSGERCFVMPLDREVVAPPQSLFDMIQRIQHGQYQVNTRRIRQTMRVIQTPLDRTKMDLGQYIPLACKGRPIYGLAKIGDPTTFLSRKRRSAGKDAVAPVLFREFAGNGVVEFEIYE
ncbi:unnamed protein product [Cyprideis torosa]|uniref:Uncharacterized protein n=1 Tax=Cyprideis torosa TaxID=163714 RepID=A0A7R8ZLD8_9CRUS|nr:unnamed protein product [Cyprideis torosa]CAG0891575.1 unnamed protein product [Cyprideis torosa]